ncbi:MAG: hypothetical protein ACRDI1_04300 [Actinomycetota bacterium]
MKAVAKLAAAQFGLVERSQLLEKGFSKSWIQRSLSKGKLETFHRRVYRVAGSPPSWQQSLMGVLLWLGPDSAVSHRAAAALWKLDGFESAPVEVATTLRIRHKPADGVVVHNTDFLPAKHVTKIGRLQVTNAARTLADLGAVVPEPRVGAALDDALRRKLVTLARLQRVIEEMSAKGRNGVGVLRRLVDRRDPAQALPESVLEDRIFRAIVGAGLPPPVRQHRVQVRGETLARIDLAYPPARVAIEADGYRYHSGRDAWENDLRRQNALTALGWTTLRVGSHDLKNLLFLEQLSFLLRSRSA